MSIVNNSAQSFTVSRKHYRAVVLEGISFSKVHGRRWYTILHEIRFFVMLHVIIFFSLSQILFQTQKKPIIKPLKSAKKNCCPQTQSALVLP